MVDLTNVERLARHVVDCPDIDYDVDGDLVAVARAVLAQPMTLDADRLHEYGQAPASLDVERLRRAFRSMMDKGLLTGGFIHDDQWAAVFEMEYERAK